MKTDRKGFHYIVFKAALILLNSAKQKTRNSDRIVLEEIPMLTRMSKEEQTSLFCPSTKVFVVFFFL